VAGRNTGTVSNAVVYLSGIANATVLSDANGNYVFNNVGAGEYSVIATKEGYQMARSHAYFYSDPSNNMVATADINLVDNPALVSVVLDKSTSPETVVVTFTEAMDKSSVVASLSYDGTKTFGVVESETSWSTDNKILYVRPKASFNLKGRYSLILKGRDGSTSASMRDLNDNLFDRYGNSTSYSYYSESYYIGPVVYSLNVSGSEEAPVVAPTNLKVINSSGTTEIDYQDINYYYETLYLSWDVVSGAPAYKVYCSYAGGPYQFYGQVSTSNIAISPGGVDSVLADFTRTGDYSCYDFGSGLIWPFIGSGIDFKVMAANSGGEGPASAVINIKDVKKPRITSTNYSSSTEVYVYFSEPLEKTSAENISNYTITGQTIGQARLTNDYNWSNYYVYLKLSPGATSGKVEVSTAVQDLSGNGMDPNYNKGTPILIL
jgi:hypothetical protein